MEKLENSEAQVAYDELQKSHNALQEKYERDTAHLKHRISILENLLLGRKTEQEQYIQENPDQPFLDFGDELVLCDVPEEPVQQESTEGQKETEKDSSDKKGKNRQSRLAVKESLETEEYILDIPDDEKIDPITGEELKPFSYDTSETIVYVKATFKRIIFKRPVYSNSKKELTKADAIEKLMPGFEHGSSLISYIGTSRFADHLPYFRLVQILKRLGFEVNRQGLSRLIIRFSDKLHDLWQLLKIVIKQSNAIFVDETPVRALSKTSQKGDKKTDKSYLWCMSNSPPGKDEGLIFFDYYENRKHQNAIDFIGDYQGILHSDKYQAYEALAADDAIIWQPCWVHARRKFIEAPASKFRNEALRVIKIIFKNEKECWKLNSDGRKAYRQNTQKPVVDKFIAFLEANANLPAIQLCKDSNKAINYILNQKDNFCNFLDYAEARIHNNTAERGLRPVTVGRRNWLFVGNEKGGKAAAIMYSFVQSCKNLGINPEEYLEDLIRNLPYAKSEEQKLKMLPHLWQKKEHPVCKYLPASYPCKVTKVEEV